MRRLQKVLEGANIKLGDVATDVMGLSGRSMVRALAEGEQDSNRLAGMARGKMRPKRQELQLALEGSVRPHQRFMLRNLLEHIEFLEARLEQVCAEIEERMRPFENALRLLRDIPGVGRRVAESILAEVGCDMSYWPTHQHFASWARLCPGNNESAGKRRSTSIGSGHSSLRGTLVEAALAAARTKNTYFAALYRRIAARRGNKRAVIAIAHAILVVVYHCLQNGVIYQDLGANYFEQINREALVKRTVRRLERLGYNVTLQEVPSAA